MRTEPSSSTEAPGCERPAPGCSVQRLRALLAPSPPYRLTVQQCIDALDLLAAATITGGPITCVIGIPGTSGALTPAETLAAHHRVPFHQAGELPDQNWADRILVVCDSDRSPELQRSVTEFETGLAPGGRVETAVLVSHRSCAPRPDWSIWRTGASVLFPWDSSHPDSAAARCLPNPREVHRS